MNSAGDKISTTGVDLDAVSKLVHELERDLEKLQHGSGDVGALRDEVRALGQALQAPAPESGETAALRAKLAADPKDHQARYDLAMALDAGGDRDLELRPHAVGAGDEDGILPAAPEEAGEVHLEQRREASFGADHARALGAPHVGGQRGHALGVELEIDARRGVGRARHW